MAITSILKKLGAALLGAGSSLVIAACYGAYYDDWSTVASGRVKTADGTGIPEMQVCLDLTTGQYCEGTDIDGNFLISEYNDVYDRADAEGYTLQVRDVDGLAHGDWADQDVDIGPGHAGEHFDITMDPAQ
jgi:hypothetical protein